MNSRLLFVVILLFAVSGRVRADSDAVKAAAESLREVCAILKTRDVSVDPEKAASEVEHGILKAVDPAAMILTPEQAVDMKNRLAGIFYGVGVKIASEDGKLNILDFIEGGPAEGAGILKGDRIVKVNELEVEGMELKDMLSLLEGKKGDVVEFTLEAPEENAEQRVVAVTLAEVQSPAINCSEEWPHDLCYMKVDGLYGNAGKAIVRQFRKWEDSAFFGAILDLRGSNGEDLDSVAEVAGLFAAENTKLFSVMDGKNVTVKEYVAGGADRSTMPLMVLVDDKTCCAAEVLAAVLKACKGAMLIGTHTLGDDRIREFLPYKDKILYVAVQRVIVEKGNDYRGTGVKPDIMVRNGGKTPVVEPDENERIRVLTSGLTDEEKLDQKLLRRVGRDVVLGRAADILLGLRALDINAR